MLLILGMRLVRHLKTPALSKKTPIATPPPPSQKAPYTTPTQVAKPTKKRSKNRERVFLFIPLKSWKQN